MGSVAHKSNPHKPWRHQWENRKKKVGIVTYLSFVNAVVLLFTFQLIVPASILNRDIGLAGAAKVSSSRFVPYANCTLSFWQHGVSSVSSAGADDWQRVQ